MECLWVAASPLSHSLSKPLFDLPMALAIGPQRTASTWLDRYLRARGDVCLPHAVKEVMFFNRHYDRGAGFYRAHFRPVPAHRMIMEVTAQSFDCAHAPKRVRDVLGADVKLLCPLRHPVQRSYSLYLHYLRYGIVQGGLKEAVRDVPQIITSSRYADHLARWHDIFPAIHLTYQEELDRDAGAFVANVCRALDLPMCQPASDIAGRYNVTSAHRNHRLARAAQLTGDWLRDRRFYGLVNMAKRLGLKNFIFGIEKPDIHCYTIPADEAGWLYELLGPEIDRFEKLTGRTDHGWHTLIPDDARAA